MLVKSVVNLVFPSLRSDLGVKVRIFGNPNVLEADLNRCNVDFHGSPYLGMADLGSFNLLAY